MAAVTEVAEVAAVELPHQLVAVEAVMIPMILYQQVVATRTHRLGLLQRSALLKGFVTLVKLPTTVNVVPYTMTMRASVILVVQPLTKKSKA